MRKTSSRAAKISLLSLRIWMKKKKKKKTKTLKN